MSQNGRFWSSFVAIFVETFVEPPIFRQSLRQRHGKRRSGTGRGWLGGLGGSTFERLRDPPKVPPFPRRVSVRAAWPGERWEGIAWPRETSGILLTVP